MNLPLLSVVQEGAVNRVQRRKDRHLSLLDLVVEFPDDGRHAGRVVQDERRGRVLKVGDLGDVKVDLGLARHGEQRVLHRRRGHLVRNLVEELGEMSSPLSLNFFAIFSRITVLRSS